MEPFAFWITGFFKKIGNPFLKALRAFRIAAGVTDHAAAFMFNSAAALRAGAESHVVFVVEFLVAFTVVFFGMFADCLGDCVSTRGYPVFTEACRFVTADADELFDDRLRLLAGRPFRRK